MTWTAPQITRADEILTGDERHQLQNFLDRHRDTLLWKCSGLTADQLKRASVPTTTLTLLGLVRHMAEVERGWFRHTAAAEDGTPIYCSDDNVDGDFDDVAGADAEADMATFRRELELCDAAVADLPLDHEATRARGDTFSLRWIYLHMIEEYARHNGHADLLREAIDGETGE